PNAKNESIAAIERIFLLVEHLGNDGDPHISARVVHALETLCRHTNDCHGSAVDRYLAPDYRRVSRKASFPESETNHSDQIVTGMFVIGKKQPTGGRFHLKDSEQIAGNRDAPNALRFTGCAKAHRTGQLHVTSESRKTFALSLIIKEIWERKQVESRS